MEAINSSETPVLTASTPLHIAEVSILQIDYRENLKPYVALTGWTL
jgi:hypothetical protein